MKACPTSGRRTSRSTLTLQGRIVPTREAKPSFAPPSSQPPPGGNSWRFVYPDVSSCRLRIREASRGPWEGAWTPSWDCSARPSGLPWLAGSGSAELRERVFSRWPRVKTSILETIRVNLQADLERAEESRKTSLECFLPSHSPTSGPGLPLRTSTDSPTRWQRTGFLLSLKGLKTPSKFPIVGKEWTVEAVNKGGGGSPASEERLTERPVISSTVFPSPQMYLKHQVKSSRLTRDHKVLVFRFCW